MDPELTDQQKMVLSALMSSEAPLGAYDLLDQLREHGLRAPPQIYRALSRLEKLGRVHRVDSLNAYVACCHQHGHEAHVAVLLLCEDCGRADERQDNGLHFRLQQIAGEAGMTARRASVEVRGLCRGCRTDS